MIDKGVFFVIGKIEKHFVIILIFAFVIISTGCVGDQPWNHQAAVNGSEGLLYTLPLQTGEIVNYGTISEKIPLSSGANQKLLANGFVVVNNTLSEPSKSIADMYIGVQNSEVPVFITSDSALYLYHMAFEGSLERQEFEEFYPELKNISRGLLDESVKTYNFGPENEREAARLNVAYFAVAVCLLYPDSATIERQSHQDLLHFNYSSKQNSYDTIPKQVPLPPGVAEEIGEELALIKQHNAYTVSPVFHYLEDYTQYIPRGHYARSIPLSQYFRAMMWYGRMSFILSSNPECPVVSPKYADIHTTSALLITSDLEANPQIREKWVHIYNVTSLFAGRADDLGPNEYRDAMNAVTGNTTGKFLITDASIGKVRFVLLSYRAPVIYSGTGGLMPKNPGEAEACLESTKGFRFFGQRASPDAYIISRLTYPNVGRYTGEGQPFTYFAGTRGFPVGLDVMALIGSGRARTIMNDTGDSRYEGYDREYQNLEKNFSSLNEEDWHRDLYWGWLHSLQPVLIRKGAGYPTFMQTEAWSDKDLNAALASWTALRHDTLLYEKENYILMGVHPGPKSVPGYVEPNPELYFRLENLTNMTLNGMEDKTGRYGYALYKMIPIYHHLGEISEKELNNQELSPEDYTFINGYGTTLKSVMSEDELWNGPTLVADVYTELTSRLVVEEGMGIAQLAVVAYKVPDGRIVLGAGPVLPYYEFKQPMAQRLTDDQWWKMLINNPPLQPNWTTSFTAV